MSSRPSSRAPGGASTPASALIAGRFRVVRTLGSGGMATVYEATDVTSGRTVALKRLRPSSDPARQRRVVELFRREFYTLAQIAHPNIVSAHEYGVDEFGPYFTMELVAGRELIELAPIAWRAACRLASDIASALSLLHSRRLVYRDLNPRNVRRTPEGAAKLLDFGATTSMGVSKQVVGTPAYCPPEVLDLQPLDGRTDLYALGATLYFMLTGKHAYVANAFSQLRAAWTSRPAPPSDLVDEVPDALDGLVMELLQLQPAARPHNATEVIERLSAIAGHSIDEHLQVRQAYLSTPSLVGREPLLARIKLKTERTLLGRGHAVILNGGSGVGRTRLLGAAAIDAQLLGALVLRADATDAANGDYGVLRALAIELLEIAPDLATEQARPNLVMLGHVLPELLRDRDDITLERFDPNDERGAIIAALRSWFYAVSDQRPLVIAVDDMQSIDEPSAAVLALLARDIETHALSILVSVDTDATPGPASSALKLFAGSASKVRVASLSAQDTECLLRSVFGEAPALSLVASKLYAIAGGNPRDTLQIAQYLVDRELARYRAGAWSMPAHFDDGDLPASMSQALRSQVEARSARARELARALTLSPDRGLSFEECVTLCPLVSATEVMDSLDELVACQIVDRWNDTYVIAHRGFQAAIEHGIDLDEQRRLHAGLANVFERRGNEEFRRAIHLLEAGELSSALDVFVAFASRSQQLTEASAEEFEALLRSIPEDGLTTFLRFIALSKELERPTIDTYVLQRRLLGLVQFFKAPGEQVRAEIGAVVEQLRCDSGLDDFASTRSELPSEARIRSAIAAAQARYDASSIRARVNDPTSAIRQLVHTQLAAAGLAMLGLDYELWRGLPDLTPILPLSPALQIANDVTDGVGARLRGRTGYAGRAYRALLDRLDRCDHAELDPAHHRILRCALICALGAMEAGLGLARSLSWADALEDEPLCQVAALQIRMLHGYWQGRAHEGDSYKQRAELRRIELSSRQLGDGTHLIAEVTAHAQTGDLSRLKQTIEEVRLYAQHHAGWAPVLTYASGEYQRIRGDHALGLTQLSAAREQTRAGEHQVWPFAAGGCVQALVSLGRVVDALAIAEESLGAAEVARLDYAINFIKLPYALALAEASDFEKAERIAEDVIASVEAQGSEGLSLALAYETRARVAVRSHDAAGYERYAALCRAVCLKGDSRVLRAKYERLSRAGNAAGLVVSLPPPAAERSSPVSNVLTSLLADCEQANERAERTLGLLVQKARAMGGLLYLLDPSGPALAARLGVAEIPSGLLTVVRKCVDAHRIESSLDIFTVESIDDADDGLKTKLMWPSERGAWYHFVVLSHQAVDGYFITGVAVLIPRPHGTFMQPSSLAAHLSRLMLDAGDVTPIHLPN